jgi:HAD superfamily hydrolase (TIGR01509 family)
MALRGVIFDLDGVLCDSEPFLAEAAATMFEQHYGLQLTPADFQPFVGTGEDNYLQGVAEHHGITLDLPRDKEATYNHYLKAIRCRLQPMPGAIDIIQGCLARGIRIGVATNADLRKVEGNLREIGLPPDKFHAVVSGDDVTRKKPDPEIFTLTAHQLGLSPTDCLVIEDSPAGVAAAKAAGAHCLGITTSFNAEALCQHGADWTAPNPARLPMAAVCW